MDKKNVLKLSCLIFSLCLIIPQMATAQYKFGITDVSVAIADVKHGLPFYLLFPIHPGIELSTTVFKKEKEKSFHAFDATLGLYHHKYIANATYLNVKYNYQYRIKNIVGIDLHSGLGFQCNIYPGTGYEFNENSKEFESTVNTKGNLLVNAGFGLSYLKHEKIQPFFHYDMNGYNLWAFTSYVNLTAILKAGVKINL